MDDMILTVDHLTYKVKRYPSEFTNIRLWAIAKQFPKSESEYHAALTLSKFWYYSNHLKCVYNAAIERRIKDIEL